MQMPQVKVCKVKECAYNSNENCRAIAITVGDEEVRPKCDTFYPVNSKGGDENNIAGVGACKMEKCVNNQRLECQAPGIKIGFQQSEIDCLTFKPRD